jgi:ribosomal protein S3
MEDYILNLDKPRKLKFGFKADRLLTEKYGEMEIWDLKKKALQEFVYFAWAGLVWEDESLTVERIEELLDEKIGETYTQFDIINLIANALVAHLGAESDKKKVEKKIPTKKTVKSPMKSA